MVSSSNHHQLYHPTTVDASREHIHAPLHVQYTRQVEMQAFYDKREDQVFSYEKMSGLVNKYGFAGLTHLSPKQLQACFSKLDDQEGVLTRSIYFR